MFTNKNSLSEGHSASFSGDNLITGTRRLPMTWDYDRVDLSTLQVYRNGVAMNPNHYDLAKDYIEISHPIKSIDDDIEVRVKYFNPLISDILLLPRSGLDDDELENLFPDPHDTFSVDWLRKIAESNQQPLESYTGHRCKAMSIWIREDGIRAQIKILL